MDKFGLFSSCNFWVFLVTTAIFAFSLVCTWCRLLLSSDVASRLFLGHNISWINCGCWSGSQLSLVPLSEAWISNGPMRSAAPPALPCSHCRGANNHPRNGAQGIPAHSASLHSHSRTMQLNFPCVVFVLITVFHDVQKSGFFNPVVF